MIDSTLLRLFPSVLKPQHGDCFQEKESKNTWGRDGGDVPVEQK